MARKNNEHALFDVPEDWEEEWKDMPEFIQNDLTPVRSIIVHFDKPEDVQKFAALVEQHITPKTKSIWYPQATIGRLSDKRWIDEGQQVES